jgi:hypothetical protein
MGLRKKKLGERIGAGLVQLKGNEETPQVFSIISGDILSYDYHYDDIYNQLGRFMCFSEYDDNGKIIKKADCCKKYKKRQDRVIIPVIHYEGKKKTYRKLADAKVKYLSITSYKYNDLCKQLDEAGVDFDSCNVDILLKCEDEKRGKISFDVIDSDEGALWREDDEMKKMVKDALETWEDDVMASLPVTYTPEEFNRLIAEAEAEGEAPEGVEEADSEIPKKKKSSEKTKAKVEKDLDDEFDDEEDEDETPKKKKKKSVKEQIEEEDFDNEDLDEEDEDDTDDEEDEDEEDESPKKKKSKKKSDDEDEDDEDLDDEDEDDE